jgi:hypothetical protein
MLATDRYYAIFLNVPILAIAVALTIAMCGLSMFAQSGAGSIQGTVTDATGGIIPAAAVHVVNDDTGVAADTKSNGAGFYQVPGLFTGHYRVTFAAPGMKTYTTAIQLLVAQSAVIDPVLTAGAVTQQVVVPGDTVQLTTTDNGMISSTLENARINQLPENGRDLGTLLTETTPGIENNGANINGLEPEAFEYVVDGVPTQADLHGGNPNTQHQLLDPDAVQEVRIEADGGGAEYATPATSIVSTKSGTNMLHGTAFETARNNATGIAKSRQDPSNYLAPHYVRNEFGASAGGPIILPHVYHGKDKSFWFFAYERYSLADSAAVLATTPTVAMSQGNFSGLISSKNVLQTLYDPSTTKNSSSCAATGKANAYCRTPFPSNTIPTSEEGPLAKLYYELAPLPTNSSDPLVEDNLTVLAPEFIAFPQETFRLDHEFNSNNHAYLRYTQNVSTHINTKGAVNRAANYNGLNIPAGAAVGDKVYAQNPNNVTLAAIGYTHIFSPTFFAETVASQQWFNTQELPGARALTPNVNYEQMFGLPNNFGGTQFPAIGQGSLLFPLGPSVTNEEQEAQITSDLDENLTKIVGRNQIQFGGRFRHGREAMLANHVDDLESLTANPTAVYQPTSGANYTTLANTGEDEGSFFIGSANTYTASLNPPRLHFHAMEFDGYFQDNYHLSRSLTVNLGLRYEAHPAFWTKYGLMNDFDLKNHALVLAAPQATLIAQGFTTQALLTNMENIGITFETSSEFGVPANSLLRNYNLNFLPRAGIAYQLFGGRHGTVIRGAYGRYTAPTPVNDFQDRAELNPPFGATYTMSYAAANQAIDDLPNELLRYNDPVEFGVMGVNTANVVNTNATNSLLPGSAFINASPTAPRPSSPTPTSRLSSRSRGIRRCG